MQSRGEESHNTKERKEMEGNGTQRNTRVTLTIFLVALLLGGCVISPVSAAYSIGKYKSDGFNWQMTLTGSDLTKAKTLTGAAYYSNKAADWVISNYFGKLKSASDVEKAFRQIGLPVPPAAQLTVTGIKIGVAAKIFTIITGNAYKATKQFDIWTVAPPYPANWKVGIHN